jgi:hypothetical protein
MFQIIDPALVAARLPSDPIMEKHRRELLAVRRAARKDRTDAALAGLRKYLLSLSWPGVRRNYVSLTYIRK